MGVTKKAGAALAALAMASMAAAPAMADPRRGHDRGHHRKHDKDDDAVGGFVLGALLAGGLALALSGKKKEPKPLPEDVAFVPVADAGTTPGAAMPAQADEEAATEACVASAEEQARQRFPVAQVAGVASVEPVGPGFTIKGDVLVRSSYREAGVRHAFRCTVDGDAVNAVTIDGITPTA
jgi:hypothetical protein